MFKPSDVYTARILIVDDIEANVALLARMLRTEGYSSINSTSDPFKVCWLYRRYHYDLILLDLAMPGMDGFQVIEALREIETEDYVPVLVITAEPSHKLRALRIGAKDFISKPFELAEVLARVSNMLEVRLLHNDLKNNNEILEKRVLEKTIELQESYLETIFTMTRAAEHKDEDTGAHVQRISYYSRDLARIIGMDDVFINNIFFASPMHDVGKIGIPDHVLLKPAALTTEEWDIMKGHSAMGARILGNGTSVYLRMGAEIALNHHERWDGGGYPSGTRGDAIPISARIMNICDVYDALRSKRPYKPAFDHMEAVNIITCGDGRTQPSHFDPEIISVFKQYHQTFNDIFETNTPSII